VDSKEVIFNQFFDLLCDRFGGSAKMYERFDQLCSEAGEKFRLTPIKRLNRMELMILVEALTVPKALTADEYEAKYPNHYTVDQMLEDAEYKEEA
jgi:hypothetical protein